jgi:uncharacterized membrane protein SirB2
VTAESYLALKHLHQGCAGLSIGGFVLRWLGGLARQPWVHHRVVRTLPHVVDTVLLASAVTLVVAAGINPLETAWLATKIICLLVYIGLGSVALSERRSRRVRALAGMAAVAVFMHIVAVAVSKRPGGWLPLTP